MVFYGYHGVYQAERELGQKIEVDLELMADFSGAVVSDDLDETINYPEIYSIVKEIVEEGGYNLIEGIAGAIAERLWENYSLIGLTVRVRKPQPPVGGLMDAVEFELVRQRD
jgi:dihydroneopterin aldolase